MCMLQIGSTSPQEESYTTRMLRAAITPERVHQIRNASLSDLASLLRSITMRMAMLLQAAPESSEYYSTSLAEVVDQYAQVSACNVVPAIPGPTQSTLLVSDHSDHCSDKQMLCYDNLVLILADQHDLITKPWELCLQVD